MIDARDQARFILDALEGTVRGTFNLTGPLDPTTLGEALEAMAPDVAPPGTELTFVPWSFLETQGVKPWSDLPAWLPAKSESAAILNVSLDRVARAGLTCLPLAATATDTLAWWQGLPEERRATPLAGLPAAREAALLAAWRATPNATRKSSLSGSSER